MYCASDSLARFGYYDPAFGLVSGFTFEEPNSIPTKHENLITSPAMFHLNPAYPNPFNSTITIPFQIDAVARVNFGIYDVNGKEISILHNSITRPGDHTLNWNATQTPNGVYFLRAESGRFSGEQKLVLVK